MAMDRVEQRLRTVTAALDEAGIPSVLVEAEIGDPLPGQVVTRIESFKEVIS